MARSLTIQRSTIPSSEREKYLDKLKVRRDHYRTITVSASRRSASAWRTATAYWGIAVR